MDENKRTGSFLKEKEKLRSFLKENDMCHCFSCKFIDELNTRIFNSCITCKRRYCDKCEYIPDYLRGSGGNLNDNLNDNPGSNNFYCNVCMTRSLRAIGPY